MAGGLCIDEESNAFVSGFFQLVQSLVGIRTIVRIIDLNRAAAVLFFVEVCSILVTWVYCRPGVNGRSMPMATGIVTGWSRSVRTPITTSPMSVTEAPTILLLCCIRHLLFVGFFIAY